MTYPPDHEKAMERLYDKTLQSNVSTVGCDWLYRAHLLLLIADDDPILARDVIHTDAGRKAARREYDQLSDEQRRRIGIVVGGHWASCVKKAIGQLWHACVVLDVDPTTLDGDHVALVAATLLSRSNAD